MLYDLVEELAVVVAFADVVVPCELVFAEDSGEQAWGGARPRHSHCENYFVEDEN